MSLKLPQEMDPDPQVIPALPSVQPPYVPRTPTAPPTSGVVTGSPCAGCGEPAIGGATGGYTELPSAGSDGAGVESPRPGSGGANG